MVFMEQVINTFQKEREYLDKSDKIITIHLGNGCSMTAIKDGISIDHSLGSHLLTDLLWVQEAAI
jgi:acetate kinase